MFDTDSDVPYDIEPTATEKPKASTADSAAGFGVVAADCRSRAASCSGVTFAVRTISLTSAASAS